MTQEDKELLIKDLCCRLPYKVKVQAFDYELNENIETLYSIDADGYTCTLECDTLKHTHKPYLFPMSSMTEEQEIEFKNTCNGYCEYYWTEETIDWLNKNHFDYRGLIKKGLAIDATRLNIYSYEIKI